MAHNTSLELDSYLLLEDPLLESIVALHLMSTGHNIVPRRSSYGAHHDILVELYNGYIFLRVHRPSRDDRREDR